MPKGKLSKSTIFNIVICAVLSLMLVLSLTFSLSGAWFTDSASYSSDDVTFVFGTVQSGPVSVSSNVANLYPGQTITYQGNGTSDAITYTGNVSAYYRVSFAVAKINNEDTIDINDIKSKLAFTSASVSSDGNIYGTFKVSGNSPVTSIPKGYIQFSANAGNTYQQLAFKVIVTIDVIQAANLTESEVTGITNISTAVGSSLQTIYQNIFNYYDGLSS